MSIVYLEGGLDSCAGFLCFLLVGDWLLDDGLFHLFMALRTFGCLTFKARDGVFRLAEPIDVVHVAFAATHIVVSSLQVKTEPIFACAVSSFLG